ncbi:MAG: DUF6777 domain-containing protein [Actinomycetota bacterium]
MDLQIDGLADAERVGSGGNAIVYRARQVDLDRWVAVKMLRLGHDPDSLRRFERERKLMARISSHPNIAPIYFSGYTGRGEPFLVMPFYPAGSLEDAGAMPWASAAELMVGVASAVAHAHDHDVLHRDLKPGNVMRDDRGQPIVVDFGIAQVVSGTQSISTAITLTPSFAPPEAFEGPTTDPRSDVYALGATLHGLIGGAPPFATGNEGLYASLAKILHQAPPQLPGVPVSIAEVMERAMAKRVDDRQPNAHVFRQELADALAASGGPVVTADPHGSSAIAVRPTVDDPGTDAGPSGTLVEPIGVPPTPTIDEPPGPTGAPASGPPSAPVAAPELAGSSARSPAKSGPRRWPLVAAAIAVVAAAIAGFTLLRGSDQPGVQLVSAVEPGPGPFVETSPPIIDLDDPDLLPLEIADDPGVIVTIRGDAPGLYGASSARALCDTDAVIDQLNARPDRLSAWADVASLVSSQAASRLETGADGFLKTDVVVTLASLDTETTEVTTIDAVLERGTVVLIDEFGVPFMRCRDGAPILPASSVDLTADPVGTRWSGFDPADVIAIVPGTRLAMLDVDDLDAPGTMLATFGPDRTPDDSVPDDSASDNSASDNSVSETSAVDDVAPSTGTAVDPIPTVAFGTSERTTLDAGAVTIDVGAPMSFLLPESREALSQEGHLLVYVGDAGHEVDIFRPFSTDLRFELPTIDDVVTYVSSDSRFRNLERLESQTFAGLDTQVFQGTTESFLAFRTTETVDEGVGWRSPPLLRMWIIDAPHGPVVVTAESPDEDLVAFDETTRVALAILASMSFAGS